MKTLTMKDVNNKTYSKAMKIYPVNQMESKNSIGIKLTKEEAIDLARQLMIGASKWDVLRITALRSNNNVTVTSQENWTKGEGNNGI